jgi:hypothetical protein
MSPLTARALSAAIAPCLLVLVIGCDTSKETESQALRQEIARLKSEVKKLEDQKSIIMKLLTKGEAGVWTLDWNDSVGIFEPRILERYPIDQATPSKIVNGLNRLRPSPGVDYIAQRAATVYLRIKDPELLTQRMGTTGANEYLGYIVLSVTSIPDVELVHFDFPEGDHAVPGFYSRARFIP